MTPPSEQAVQYLKDFTDGASAVAVVAVLMKALPAVAAVFTIVWTGFRIYESYLHSKKLRQELAAMREKLRASVPPGS